jgi:integrase
VRHGGGRRQLPRRVITQLEEHRTAYSSTGLIFTSEEGKQVRVNNLRRRHWAAAVRQAGLDWLTFHHMRHTAVSLWAAAGASDLEVAKWAGHRSAAFTKSRYAHLFPEHGQAPADRLDASIAASTPAPAAAVVPIRPF